MKQTVLVGLLLAGGVSLVVSSAAFAACGGVDTAIINCADGSDDGGGIWYLVTLVINVLTAGIGLIAVGGVMYGGFLYATAGDKADQVTKAVHTIVNVGIGVVGYFLIWSFLQFLIPGGVFN